MKIYFILLSCCTLLFLSCVGDKTSSDALDDQKEEVKRITAKAIEAFDYPDYALSKDGEAVVANWEKYKELAIQVDYLKKADLSFFNGDKFLLSKFIDTLKMELPEQLTTNAITSRTAVIETMLMRLNENLTLDNIEYDLQLESVKEVMIAFSNLNYQINNKLVRDKYQIIKSQY